MPCLSRFSRTAALLGFTVGLGLFGGTLWATVLLPPPSVPVPVEVLPLPTYDTALHMELLRMNHTLVQIQQTLVTCVSQGPGRGPVPVREQGE